MLTIGATDLLKIYEHCDREYPNEACGLLAGHDHQVFRAYPMRNARPSPGTYEMEPDEQFRVMRDIRRAGLEMIGIYHSHTGGPAYPSSVDVEKAYWPGTLSPNYPEASYLIVTLRDRKRPAARVFTITEKQIMETALQVSPEGN